MVRAFLSFAALLAVSTECLAFMGPSTASVRALGSTQGRSVSTSAVSRQPSRGMLSMASKKDEEAARQLSNMARAARKVGPNDRVVELRKPMGLVLEEDERGNVYIVEIVPGGNASRKKQINVGDKITFVSATFGEEIWSAQGVGLSRVQSAIRIRSGPTVKLVLETSKEAEKKMARDSARLKKIQDAKETEEDKRDRLLRELSDDTKVQKKKPWYGLF
ncbi:unnamed protein product [Ectocarpus sp. CCAP 1310/34]|nr:unnamed protein product [Ectocarpus sp. CCAP 1310/34]